VSNVKCEGMLRLKDFLGDKLGRRFSDVVTDRRLDFSTVLKHLSDPNLIRRMHDSEDHHDRPALAGVIRELEALPFVQRFFSNHSPQQTLRFRQAVGVAVKILMEKEGRVRTGNKGSLDHLSRWFTRAERYKRQ
jgi:hypothetical protein